MVTIKLVDKVDLGKVASLAKIIWHQHYVPIIGEKQVEYMLNRFYSSEALIQQVNEGQEFYFILVDDVILGFLSISHKSDDVIFIHKFYIDQTQQSKGIGSQVFETLKLNFPKAKTYRLTVNRQNFKSINFYFKNGFIIESVEDFNIGDGYFMNDFVMVWKEK